MICMERIEAHDARHITYRGELVMSSPTGDLSRGITEDASVPMPAEHRQSAAAKRQCMLTVVNKLIKRVKKEIVHELDCQFRETGSFDTTAVREPGWRLLEHEICRESMALFKFRIKADRGHERLEAEFLLDSPDEFEQQGIIDRRTGLFYLDRVPCEIRRRANIRISGNLEELRVSARAIGSREIREEFMRRNAAELSRTASEEMRRSFFAALPAISIDPEQVYWNDGHIVFRGLRRPERNTPDRRAMALLARKIGKVRYRSLMKNGCFQEQGKHGVFRFHKDKQGGVTFTQKIKVGGLKERSVTWDLCVQSQAADLPNGDVILSRWLEWKADEDRFLETANFRNISTADEATELPLRSVIQGDNYETYSEALRRMILVNVGIPEGMIRASDIRA